MTFVSANSVTPISGTSYKPVFTQTGYTLIYSNNPETIDNNNQLADTNHYLYGDTSPGRTRCFFHHANSTGNTISIRIEIVNPSNETVNLFVSNKGIGTHSNPVSAGAVAWQQWLTQAPVSGGAAGADNYVRTIGANSTDYYIALETIIANGLTAAGIMDFVAVGNTSGSIRPLRVKVYAYKNAPVFSPGSPAAIAVPYQTLGSDSSWFGSVAGQTVYYGHYGFESVVRGTFQHCTRTTTVNWNSTSGSRFLELFTRHTSVFVNPNEFEAGTDVTQPSGSQTVPKRSTPHMAQISKLPLCLRTEPTRIQSTAIFRI
ncbi:hypothetical protein [Paenibacillus riograndensis]|uniref:hypothetical protein n=1 Tax=Paenibacillus riograndensis TaxID=483937 RepID=UPI000A48F5B8|nr:hypothetical protein [Paenibacillus riograndensis]